MMGCMITDGLQGDATAGRGIGAVRNGDHMLWTIVVGLVILWLLGLVSGHTADDVIHVSLFIAIIVMLIQIENDCSDYVSDHTRKRSLERRV